MLDEAGEGVSQGQLIGIISALFGLLMLMIGIVWRQFNQRVERLEASRVDEINREIGRIWDQIGRDSDSGMRKLVHTSGNKLTWIEPVVKELEVEIDRLKARPPHRRLEDER